MEYITKVYVINLDKDTDRLQTITNVLNKLNIPFSRFPAIQDKVKLSNLDSYKLNKGEYGCMASHFMIYDELLQEPEDECRYLIFEDDANTYIEGDFVLKSISKVYDNGFDPDLLYLGKCSEKCQKMQHCMDNIYFAHEPLCMHAYIISKNGARLIRSKMAVKALDHHILDVKRELGLDIMAFHPSLFYQDIIKHGSNLRGNLSSTALGICNECAGSGVNISDSGILGIIAGLVVLGLCCGVLFVVLGVRLMG